MRLLLLIALSWASLSAAINESVMLDSIRIVEHTKGWGKHSEYGEYQMIASVRKLVGGYDRGCALTWLRIVCADLKRRGADVNPHSVALSWNAGVRAATSGQAPMRAYDYAQRAVNTYLSLSRRPNTVMPLSPRFSLTDPMFCVSIRP